MSRIAPAGLVAAAVLLGSCSVQVGSATTESGAHVEAEELLQAQYDTYLPGEGAEVDCSFDTATDQGIPITCEAEVWGDTTVYRGFATPLGMEVYPVGETVVYGRVAEPFLAPELPPGVTASCPDYVVVPVGDEYRCAIDGSDEVAEVVMVFADAAGTPASITPIGPDGGEADVGGPAPGDDIPVLTG